MSTLRNNLWFLFFLFPALCTAGENYANIINQLDNNIQNIVQSKKGDVANYYVIDTDSVENSYKKLLIINDYYTKSKDPNKTYQIYYDNCKKAFDLHPDCAAFAARYLWIDWVKSANVPALSKIKIIMPYVQESDQYKTVPITIANIFKTYVDNVDTGLFVYGDLFKKYFSATNKEELIDNLNLIYAFWVSKINLPYSDNGTYVKIQKAKSLLSEKDNTQKAYILWSNFVNNIYVLKAETLSQEVNRISKREVKGFIESKNKDKKTSDHDDYLALLNTLKTKSNIDTEIKLSLLMLKLKQYKEYTKDSDNIPNIIELRQQYKNTQNAEIINLYYKFFIKKDSENTLNEIVRLNKIAENTRLLYLKVFCCMKLEKNFNEALKAINQVIQLSPDDERAQHLKISLEFLIKKAQSGGLRRNE